jgi:hypothetical protein
MEIMETLLATWVEANILSQDSADIFEGLLINRFHANRDMPLQ